MKRAVVLVCVLLGGVASVAALDAYPKTTLAEDATATWCGYCPYAYQGLEVVHSTYHYGEFISARYYASSGDYGSPEIDAAIDYYGITGYPTVVFNGQTKVVGGSTTTATGVQYLPIVQAAYFQPAPVRVEILSFDAASGDVQAEVTMYSATDALAGDHVRFVLLEDNVLGIHTHVTRDIINDTITLTGAGNSVVYNVSFDIDPGWNQAELHAVAFVQRDADKEVLNATCSYPRPDYGVRAMVPAPRVDVGPSTGTFAGEPFTVMNVGLADTFTINVVVDEGPPGWVTSYCDEGGTCHVGEWSFDLALDGSTEFYVNIIPDSSGYMRYHFEITSPNLASPLVVPYTYLTDDLDVLIVDDDGAATYENYYTAALDTLGLSYGIWDLSAGKLTYDVAQNYELLIWSVGESYPSLDQADRDLVMQHLDGGGRLFITGQDVGWDLNYSGSGNANPAFYNNYLHATYERDDTNLLFLNGVAGDPVSDGLVLHIAGGDGANNQEYPSEIAPRDGYATEILAYQGDGGGAIRSFHTAGGARIVYLAFGFEAIDNAADRAALLGAAIDWLMQPFADGFDFSGDTSMWSSAVQ
jgi:hypothetical protein